MSSKLVFLGTAGNSVVAAKNLRHSGGFVLKTDGVQLFFDPGPGAVAHAHRNNINLRENTAVLVSHSHLNHCNDVNALLAAMSHNKLDTRGILITNESLANSSFITPFHKSCAEKSIVATPGKRIGIEDVDITALKALHHDPKTVGFKVVTPKFTMSYSADTKYSRTVVKQYEGSDVLVLNVPHPFDSEEENALSSKDVVNIINQVKPELTVITHFGLKMLNANPVYEVRE